MHRVHGCKERHLSSFSCNFSSSNQARLDDGVQIVNATNVVDELNEVRRQYHVILQCRMNFMPSRMTLKGTQIQQVSIIIQTILKPLFYCCHVSNVQLIHPCSKHRCPLRIPRDFSWRNVCHSTASSISRRWALCRQ